MFSSWRRSSSLRTNVIEDIDGVLDAILDLCTENMKLLSHEERSSFINELSSLSNNRVNLSVHTKRTTQDKVLDQCNALKLRVQTTCRKNRMDEIRRGERVSPVNSSTTEVSRQSIKSDHSRAPSSGDSISVATNDENWHTTTTEFRGQSTESNINTALLPQHSILNHSNSITKNGGGRHTVTFVVPEQSSLNTVPSNAPVAHPTHQTIPRIYTEDNPVSSNDIECIGPGSNDRLPTFNINSESSSRSIDPDHSPLPGGSHSFPVNGENWDTATTEFRRRFTESSIHPAPLSEWSISNRLDSVTTNAQPTRRTTSRISTDSPTSHAIECMIFGEDSNVGSPTFNIDSEGATGATHTFPSGSPSRTIPRAQRPTARINQAQAPRFEKRERVMYFGTGVEADSPTYNIRSPQASGALRQVVA